MQSLGLRDEFLEAYSNAVRIAPIISGLPFDNEHSAQATDYSFFSPVLELLQVFRSCYPSDFALI
jgi:hypothetical protein